MKRILLVDDDPEFRSNLADVLNGAGYETTGTKSAKDAVELVSERDFDVVLMDFMMPKMNGIDALMALRKARPRTKVIMITAFASVENAVDAIKKGASDYLAKPFKIDELLTTIRRVLEEARFEADMSTLDVDQTLSSLANPIRRNILKLLFTREALRLMELTRELGIEDHTKVIFHLKILKEAGMIAQDEGKTYVLTLEGKKALDGLKTLERHLLR